MADTELLPCPFCGGVARHLSQRIGFWSERVICDTCDYWVRPEVWAGRATPPSPSTAPEVKTWQERCGDTGMMPSLQEASLAMKAEIADLRAALASRPAEVDDEGLPPLPEQHEELRARWKCDSCDGRGHDGELHYQGEWQPPEPYPCSDCEGAGQVAIDAYTAEQFRQGQRDAVAAYKQKQAALQELADQAQENGMGYGDAVAADRARRGDGWISVEDQLPEIGREVLVYRPKSERGTVTALARFISYEGASDFYWDNSYPGKGNMHLTTSITHWMPIPAAPFHATNEDVD